MFFVHLFGCVGFDFAASGASAGGGGGAGRSGRAGTLPGSFLAEVDDDDAPPPSSTAGRADKIVAETDPSVSRSVLVGDAGGRSRHLSTAYDRRLTCARARSRAREGSCQWLARRARRARCRALPLC